MKASVLLLIVGSALVIQVGAQLDPVCASCPSRNCTYAETLSCNCTSLNHTIQIVDPGGIEYFNVSLGFVVDDTGSMGPEIVSLKSSILDVVTATSGIFDKYVIGTFNDPYVVNVFESTNAAAINTFVNAITAHAGGDCPEYALSGIRDVANHVSPGSVIFVFTDASAKDLTLEPTVQALLLSKNIRLNVLATGNLCGGLGGEFTRLTNATNGTIYMTPNKSDVDYVMNYIKNFAKYGIRFIRVMPSTLTDLIAIANGTCLCNTSISDLVCIPPLYSINCTCPEGYELVAVKHKVCRPGSCERLNFGSLGFLIDDTGSMEAEIYAVRSQIAGIIAKGTVFKDYVAARFSDPYKKNLIRSSDASAIKAFLSAISPSGEADCPGYAMLAIEDAAKKARKNSVLILFTDASAKDASKLAAVKALLLSKNTRLYVIVSRTLCGPRDFEGEFPLFKGVLEALARASGGGVMTLSRRFSINQALEFIKLAASGKLPPTSLTTRPPQPYPVKPVNCCKWTLKYECIKIPEPCPPGYKRVTTRNQVCASPKACPRKPAGSLGFVIDNTGSMGAVITAVRTQISAIIANNTVFVDYVVASFGDPYVKNVIRSSDATIIQNFLNAIIPSGGGDCPEYAMSGIEDAATEALNNSILILFTDASAKDASKTAAVAALMVSKNIKLYVIGTGTFCGPTVYTGEFQYLAMATGGSVMTMTSTTSIEEVLDFIRMAAAGMVSFGSLPASLESLRKMAPPKICWMEEISTCLCECYPPRI